MLRRIKLRNFRQHRDNLIELVPGVNTIVGANNSGKSTIPEAVEFALYGSRALRDSAKGYITDGENDGSAVIELDVDGVVYQVGRNSRNAEVRKDGELDARYKDNVTAYVASITGVNQTGFRLGHYVRQKELAAFSSLRPGKRYETIERMLKVNAVDKAIKRLKDEASELDIVQRGLLQSYQDVDAIENELDDLRVAHGALEHRGRSLRADLEAVQAVLADQRALQLELLKKPELARLEGELQRCEQAAADVVRLEAEMLALGNTEYSDLKRQVDEMRGLERQSIAMASKREELAKPEPVEPARVPAPERPDRTRLTAAEGACLAQRQRIATLEGIAGMPCCPTCQRPVDGIEGLLGHLNDELEELEAERCTAAGEYDTAVVAYDVATMEYNSYAVAYAGYRKDVQKRQELLESYIEIAFDAEEQKRLEDALNSMREARETWLKLDGELTIAKQTLSQREIVAARIASLVYLKAIQDDPELDNTIRANEIVERELNAELTTQAADKAHTEGRMAELNRLVEQMYSIKKSIEENYESISNLKSMQDSFVLFKRHLTAKIRPLLQQVAEALFHKTTKNRYAAYNLSNDYEITLTTHRGYVRKLSTISGSENDLACLCLRLAIATLRSTKLAGSLGFIILDEISGSFDDDRTRQTLEGLLELRDVIPQIINITHKDVEMRYADKIFTVKEINGLAQIHC